MTLQYLVFSASVQDGMGGRLTNEQNKGHSIRRGRNELSVQSCNTLSTFYLPTADSTGSISSTTDR